MLVRELSRRGWSYLEGVPRLFELLGPHHLHPFLRQSSASNLGFDSFVNRQLEDLVGGCDSVVDQRTTFVKVEAAPFPRV